MKKPFKIIVASLLFIAVVCASIIYIKGAQIDVLEPKGIIAEKEKDLIVTSSLLMLIIVIPTLLLTGIFAWRYREGRGESHAPNWDHNTLAEYCWWGVPTVIIFILAIFTYRTSFELDPFRPMNSEKKPIHIQVVALQWKWLFFYPEEQIATINYIKFPVNVPVHFEITSDAPMNSFWIPQLGGQIYAMPAMVSHLFLQADEIGTYRGLSANFSGTGFAGMKFQAYAMQEDEYLSWIKEAKTSQNEMTLERYNPLVAPSENAPMQTFTLNDENLFNQILKKYTEPCP